MKDIHTEEYSTPCHWVGGTQGSTSVDQQTEEVWEENMSQLIMVSAGKDKARQSKIRRYRNSQCEYFQGSLGLS